MTQEYFCRAYHLESYSAMHTIEAENQAEAMRKLKEMAEEGELVFDGFCEGEPVNELVVEANEGDAGELTESFPENCIYAQRQINEALFNALKIAEDFMSGFEDDSIQEGIAEKLTVLRSAIAEAKAAS